ncbi:diaminopimelate decarboxylase [Candidatus Saccharibacteria bacterium]|nr:diaminopimelate decarboxylase [Candidatus Saccharibacteria bacterium]
MSVSKELPFTKDAFEDIAETYGTPVFVYDEAGIRASAQRLIKAFSWAEELSDGQRNHFAVKATPTPAILRVVHDEGMGFDCSSRPELSMVSGAGLADTGIFYSSNNTPDEDYVYANELGGLINIDKLGYLEQVHRALGGLPTRMAIRYNPGKVKQGNDIIGDPYDSKFGARPDQVIEGLRRMRQLGATDVGIHTMVVSNERRPESFAETARLLRELAERAEAEAGVSVGFLNVGGGIGINYHPDEDPVDIEGISQAIESELAPMGIPIYTEHGRAVTGSHGYLLTRSTHGIQESWHRYLQVDTSINNMARLATVSAAFHVLDVLGREGDPEDKMFVVGSMCANTDRMFKEKLLPITTQPGDLLVIHDAGAHSRAHSHNYNFRLRAGEVLVHPDGTHSLIRRPETEDDLFATTKGL